MASNQLRPSGLCPDVGKLLQVVGILVRAGTECVQGGANVTVSWGFRLNARSGPRSRSECILPHTVDVRDKGDGLLHVEPAPIEGAILVQPVIDQRRCQWWRVAHRVVHEGPNLRGA